MSEHFFVAYTEKTYHDYHIEFEPFLQTQESLSVNLRTQINLKCIKPKIKLNIYLKNDSTAII